ncbi:hypothetical protein [Mucilaginibacter kameinonensis]|uniref:hypothetical protein n=1 Tax=Mucilaginibacter kameinonensis TaxID=452286 RepID=UPI000EF796D7|nr:hypothetical protein [Mucilaginibacter kameinonensis]
MLNHWPFKKDYLLVLVVVILALAGYELAFRHTLEANDLNKQLQEQLAQQHNVADQPGYTDRKNANLDRIITLYRADTVTYRSNAINTIALMADRNQAKFVSAPGPDKNYRTETYMIQKLSFSGDFFSLLKLLNQLQAARGTGMLRSCSFRAPAKQDGPAAGILLDVFLEITIK